MKVFATLGILALMTGPALAGDGYVSTDAPRKWSGPYVGAHVGGATADVQVEDINGGVTKGPFAYSPDGVFGGLTAGYNIQLDRFVIGVEGDVGYMDMNGTGYIPSSNPGYHQDLNLDGGWYGDITARAGVTIFGNTLVYAKGGYAVFDGEASQVTTFPGYKHDGTDTFSGYVIGGGIEHFITERISLKAEYLHYNFDVEQASQTSVTDAPIGFVYKNTQDLEVDSVKVGLNFHF